MFEKKLMKLLEEAKTMRQLMNKNHTASYYNEEFYTLSNFIIKKLNSPIFKNKNIKIVANHFDEILPYIVMTNNNILVLNINSLIAQPNFKEKFIEGLKKYPYKDAIKQLLNVIWTSLDDENKFDDFIDDNILKELAAMNLNRMTYLDILNKINEDNQGKFLKLLAENKCDIHYLLIEYKGNNRQMIYDNLTLFIENAQNLYALMKFVQDKPDALSQVKKYIDDNEEKAMNSIFCETDRLEKIKEPAMMEIIKLIILDVMKNENVRFSDITYNGGGFSRILLIGDKVIKLGDRFTKKFPNNPYIVSPLLRKEFEINNSKCFVEVTERVDTSKRPSNEELYQLFKNIRNLGLIWTDIKAVNVGRLNKKNIIHWRDKLEPTEEILGLATKRGTTILEEGDLVVLDADFIYDENDPNINYVDQKSTFDEFEKRYQSEKRILKAKEEVPKVEMITEENVRNPDISEYRGIHR